MFNDMDSNRIEAPSSDILYFEIPMDSVDIRHHAQEYFCSLQRCFKCFKGGNEEETQINWIYPPAMSRNYEYIQEAEKDGEVENNFDHKFDNSISEEDVTDISFEEEEFKGLRNNNSAFIFKLKKHIIRDFWDHINT